MTFNDIYSLMQNNGKGFIWTVIVLMTLIQITPIKINPWSKLIATIGRIFNSGLYTRFDVLEQEVKSISDMQTKTDSMLDQKYAIQSRYRIIRFCDEMKHAKYYPSESHLNQIKEDVSVYRDYLDRHPDYINGIAEGAMAYALRMYDYCMDNHCYEQRIEKED